MALSTQAPTLAELASALTEKRVSSRALVEECLSRIDDEAGEGKRAFISVDRKGALTAADAMDHLREVNAAPGRFAGIPISIKDLFDIRGQVSAAGSRVLTDRPPAERDAVVVERLRRAGFILIGRTNMTEFAFSGLGINPHYGTPLNSWQRDQARVPGGSSSGAAVSVADGMAHAGLGTDTGGSCRVPAAFNGLVGYKPTANRVPLTGTIPLSFSLDSIGPIARSVACCAALDALLADEPAPELDGTGIKGLRLGLLRGIPLEGLDAAIGSAFQRALSQLSAAGADIAEFDIPEFDRLPQMNAKGGFSAAESFAWHRTLLEKNAELYDPRVAVRIRRGEEQSAVDYIDLISARKNLIAAFERRVALFDAIIMPCVSIVPPRIEELAADADYARINMLVLRNPSLINMIDGCAISLPMHRQGEAPAGLMLAAAHGHDHRLFRCAAAIEQALRA